MAFCTQCGADVKGAFCNQCGARAAQSAAAPAGAPVAPPAAPAKRRTSPMVWVLVAVLGLFGLGALAVVGTGAFLFHKARQAGVDPELWRTNPGLAVGKMAAAFNPNLEVVRTNDADGTVILRDRHTGKQFSIGIDAARNGSFSLKAAEDGKEATVEFGGNAKAPAWVPQYPESHPESVFTAKGQSENESGEAGSFTFKTPDSTSKVVAFYEEKARELGLDLRASVFGTVIAGNEDKGKYLKIVAVGRSDETFVTVTYGRKL
jgi:hypothetical protein